MVEQQTPNTDHYIYQIYFVEPRGRNTGMDSNVDTGSKDFLSQKRQFTSRSKTKIKLILP